VVERERQSPRTLSGDPAYGRELEGLASGRDSRFDASGDRRRFVVDVLGVTRGASKRSGRVLATTELPVRARYGHVRDDPNARRYLATSENADLFSQPIDEDKAYISYQIGGALHRVLSGGWRFATLGSARNEIIHEGTLSTVEYHLRWNDPSWHSARTPADSRRERC
jgi:hypothetical protein